MLVLSYLGLLHAVLRPSIKGSGTIALAALVATFLAANKKNSLFTVLFHSSWNRLVPIHRYYAVIALVLSALHFWVAFTIDKEVSATSVERTPWHYAWGSSTSWTGSVAWASMFCLCGCSVVRSVFREFFFDFWLLLHVVLAAGVLVVLAMHGAGRWMVGGIALWWGLDWLLRYTVLGTTCFRGKLIAARLINVTDTVAEIRFPRDFRFAAGQFVRIAVPVVGGLQFHPASISSAPYQNDVTLYVKDRGGWTHALYGLAQEGCEVDILLEGPYGCLSVDLDHQSHIVLVCGGIGITPIISIARQLAHEQQRSKKSVHLIWVVRELSLVRALPILAADFDLEERETTFSDMSVTESRAGDEVEIHLQTPSTHLKIEIFVTKDKADIGTQMGQSLRGSPYQVHYGSRPDIDAVIAGASDAATSLAVVACGPSELVAEASVSCRNHSRCGRTVDFHSEVFHY